MKILVLGKNGFICRSIIPLLEKEGYDLTCLSHTELDCTNLDKLREFFRKSGNFDFVIHGLLAGEGRLLKEDSADCMYQNLLILENLLYMSPFYKKLVYLGSGAKENRNKDVIFLSEGEFGEPPNSIYSLTKYLSGKRVLNNNKVLCLNIFNVFGPLEKDNRFIKLNIKKYINKQDFEIWGDRLFDFFYIEDLFIVLNHFIKNPPNKYEEFNLVYPKKYKISEITDIINTLDNYKVNTSFSVNERNNHYFGHGEKLNFLGLKFYGLRNGIKETYKILKK